MTFSFDVAGGSIAGQAHVAAGRNNQDAFCWAQAAFGLIAVVCDGCGSAAHSDVGAKLGARLMVGAVTRRLAEGSGSAPPDLLELARADVVANLRSLAIAMSVEVERPDCATFGSACRVIPHHEATRFSKTVAEHFLFTMVGVLVADGSVTPFALGDGLVVVNGQRHVLGPYPSNEPPYLGYDLLDTRRPPRSFDVFPSKDVAEVRSLLIGTDGVLAVDGTSDERQGNAAELEQFWEDDHVFRNPDMVRRRLVMMSRTRSGAAPRHGEVPRSDHAQLPRLGDDTTLVVMRRREVIASSNASRWSS